MTQKGENITVNKNSTTPQEDVICYLNQDFYKIREECLTQGKLWEDPEFEPSDTLLHFEECTTIQWKRPKEIVTDPEKKPHFFVDGPLRFDINQGHVGDCWLAASIDNLTLHPELLERVVPYDQEFDEKYAGIFHFRFWWYGQWVDVVVDDRLPSGDCPAFIDGKQYYIRSTESNEFWSSLLEKAYAKLNRSYSYLNGHWMRKAMINFTGGISQMYTIEEPTPKLLDIIVKAYKSNSLMGCSIEPKLPIPDGLLPGHAYSITGLLHQDITIASSVSKLPPLLRLRNPYGNAEWNGAWSDKSPEWESIPASQKEKIGLKVEWDGEFWMSFNDFANHFTLLEICHLSPDFVIPDQGGSEVTAWKSSVHKGKWVRGSTAGGPRESKYYHCNPQFTIKLTDAADDGKCTAIIALMQTNLVMGVDLLTMIFSVYKLDNPEHLNVPLTSEFFKNNKPVIESPSNQTTFEVTCYLRLEPGVYCVVPCTEKVNEDGKFIIRVFSEKKIDLEDIDNKIGKVKENQKMVSQPDMFQGSLKFIKEMSKMNSMDWMDLKKLLEKLVSEKLVDETEFPKEMCRSLVALMDSDCSGTLSYEELQALLSQIFMWQMIYRTYREDDGLMGAFMLKEALGSAGYQLNNEVLDTLGLRYSDSEGRIALDDFILCAVKLKTAFDYFKMKNNGHKKVEMTLEEFAQKIVYS